MFEVPASKRSIKQNRFEFKVGGATHSIPLLKFLPASAAESFEAGKQITAVIAGCDSDDAKDAIRSLDGDQLEAFMNAWAEASGVSPGESSASSDS